MLKDQLLVKSCEESALYISETVFQMLNIFIFAV